MAVVLPALRKNTNGSSSMSSDSDGDGEEERVTFDIDGAEDSSPMSDSDDDGEGERVALDAAGVYTGIIQPSPAALTFFVDSHGLARGLNNEPRGACETGAACTVVGGTVARAVSAVAAGLVAVRKRAVFVSWRDPSSNVLVTTHHAGCVSNTCHEELVLQ